MIKPRSLKIFARACSQRSGSALLIILGCVALLTVVILSFFSSARTEFSTSSFYARGASTKLLTENVINLVEAQLREGARSTDSLTSVSVAWASQPGMIRTYDTAGLNEPHLAYKYFKLYSWDNMIGTGKFDESSPTEVPSAAWASQPNNYTDLNEPVNLAVNGTSTALYPIIDPSAAGSVEGFSYTAAPGTSSNVLPMPVKWLYVLQDGTTAVANFPSADGTVTITGANASNPIVGRVAFWTDDETSKVNINTASEGTFWDTPVGESLDEIGSLSGSTTYGTLTYASINAPFGLSTSIPAAEEFQRTPGHPGTTSLSAVFGYGTIPTVLPNTRDPALTWPLTAGTTGTYATYFAPYYTITPRYQPGGSLGGAQPPVPGFGLEGYRLYDSVDELAFDPSRIAYSATNGALYGTSTGANPQGRAAMVYLTPANIEKRRFFITAHSRAPEETLFGTPRVSLWPLQAPFVDPTTQAKVIARNAKDNLLAYCSTLNVNNAGTVTPEPYYFQRATYYSYLQNGSSAPTTVPQANCSAQSASLDFPAAPTNILALGAAGAGRNENLYAYLQSMTTANIPGFGGNFLAKYPGALGVTDRDEILTEMFDLVRSGINTFNVGSGLYPNYTFTPFNYNGGTQPGSGAAVPIALSNGTHGLGRTYGIAEVSLVFMASAIALNNGTSPVAAGVTDPGNSNHMSIGPGLPWACAIDYPSLANPATFFAYDSSSGANKNYTATTFPSQASPPTIVTIGDPQTTQVQAFLIVRPYNLLPGIPFSAPNVRIRITNLEQLSLNSLPLGFPSSGSAISVFDTYHYAGGFPLGGLPDNILGRAVGNNDGSNSNYPWVSGQINIPTASPSPYGGEDPYALTTNGGSIAPVQIHPMQTSGGLYAGSTMFLGGAVLKIDVLDGVNPIGYAQTLQTVYVKIPSMTLPVPTVEMANGYPYHQQEDEACGGAGNVVAPRLLPYGGNPLGSPLGPSTYQAPSTNTPNPNHTYAFGTLNYYWQLPYDPRSISDRVNAAWNGLDTTHLINRGDVVRSFVVNPLGPSAGDMRLLAANPIRVSPGSSTIPNTATDDFIPLGGANAIYADATQGPYDSLFIKQLHSLMMEGGNYRTMMNLVATSQAILTKTDISQLVMDNTHSGQFGGGMGETNGALFPNETYAPDSAPDVTPELNGAFMKVGVPGDWTTGMGPSGDGPLVIKPDEGFPVTQNVQINGSIYFDPYYTMSTGNFDMASSLATYSPNRQIPSPIIFGTLPSRAMQGLPWCTLLFCPNPAANDSGALHPGFGVGSSTAGPTDFPPYTTPPDHLWLDLFWMPVVEPYAISEPFSTAGKVNLNYEIVPFGGYIHRSTALHAVLKSTQILALPADGAANGINANAGTPLPTPTNPQPAAQWPNLKPLDFYITNAPGNFCYRYQINLPATIDNFFTSGNTSYTLSSFYQRFNNQREIFRSASEICNIFLVPQLIPHKTYFSAAGQKSLPSCPTDASYTSMTNWWKNFKLTGDNSRETPYSQIYPRLTTKSDTYNINMRVQVITQTPADRASGTFNPAGGDSVTGEYRGSAIVERYVDPNETNPALPDFATTFPTDRTSNLDAYVRYRVVSTHAFSP